MSRAEVAPSSPSGAAGDGGVVIVRSEVEDVSNSPTTPRSFSSLGCNSDSGGKAGSISSSSGVVVNVDSAIVTEEAGSGLGTNIRPCSDLIMEYPSKVRVAVRRTRSTDSHA